LTSNSKIRVYDRVPNGYWQNIQNQRAFMDRLAVKYDVKKPEDWKRVFAKTVLKEGGTFVKDQYNGSLTKGNYCHFYNVLDTDLQSLTLRGRY
jgi:hypothetical protein